MNTVSPVPFMQQVDPAPRRSAGLDRCALLSFAKRFFECFPPRFGAKQNSGAENSKPSQLSSVTTPNGPWVYTVVPWED
jgi:hypothetical protein